MKPYRETRIVIKFNPKIAKRFKERAIRYSKTYSEMLEVLLDILQGKK